MKEEQLCRNIITETLQQPIKTLTVHDHGWANKVFEVNHEWIFRFSRKPKDREQLSIEKAFLPEFEKTSNIPIPHIEFSGDDWIAYKKLEGTPLKQLLESIDESTKEKVFKDLGSFLAKLHKSDFTHPNLREYPYGGGDFWENLWEPIESLLSKKTRINSKIFFTGLLQKIGQTPFKKTLCHADIGSSDILYNPEKKTLSGIIDFGDISMNDPAKDFSHLKRNLGENAMNSILKSYDRETEKNFHDRIKFHEYSIYFLACDHARVLGYEVRIPGFIEEIEKLFKN
jgi:aminoglycoside 2''-phosphotransferase